LREVSQEILVLNSTRGGEPLENVSLLFSIRGGGASQDLILLDSIRRGGVSQEFPDSVRGGKFRE